MADPQATRERLIEAATYYFQRRGYDGTGLSAILQRAGAPKGVLYYHFKNGKPELAEAAVNALARQFNMRLMDACERADSPANLIKRVAGLFVTNLVNTEYEVGCPLSSLAMDLAPFEPALSDVCQSGYGEWVTTLSTYLTSWSTEAPRQKAELILLALQGAAAQGKIRKHRSPLTITTKMLETVL